MSAHPATHRSDKAPDTYLGSDMSNVGHDIDYHNRRYRTETRLDDDPFLHKGKNEVRPRTGHEVPEEKCRYSSTVSLTSALDGNGWLPRRPGRFIAGKDILYPFYRRLRGLKGRSGSVQKISPSSRIRSPHRPAHSKSLYRLRYPGPRFIHNPFQFIFQ
jgi:hypothetical protein